MLRYVVTSSGGSGSSMEFLPRLTLDVSMDMTADVCVTSKLPSLRRIRFPV